MIRMSANLGARRTLSLLVSRNLTRGPTLIHYRPISIAAAQGMADDLKSKTKEAAKEPGSVFETAREELKNVGGDLAKTIAGGVSRDISSIYSKDPTAVTRERESISIFKGCI